MNTVTEDKIKAVHSALTIFNFRRWLQNHPTPENIGLMGSCSSCPIAMFLIETTGVSNIHVSPDAIQQEDGIVIYFSNNQLQFNYPPSVPEWVVQFINEVDGLRQGGSIVVSAAKALEILTVVTFYLS